MTKKLIELKSPTLVQRAYRTKYNGSTCPARKTILELARKFEKFGTLLDLPPKPKNQRELHLEAKNQLKILFTEDPSLSIRKASVATSISYSLCRDILLKELLLKPYKYQCSPAFATWLWKTGPFWPMVGGLAQWQSQMADRYGWGIFLPNGVNQQTTKSKVYKSLLHTLDDLRANITREINKINISVLKSTFFNFSKRYDLIIEKNEGHIENK